MSGRFELPHGYSPDLECQILEIPFSQRRVSMFILLPDDASSDGISKLEANMTSDNVKLLFSTLKVWIIRYIICQRATTKSNINRSIMKLPPFVVFRQKLLI